MASHLDGFLQLGISSLFQYAARISPEAPAVGQMVRDLELPANCTLAAIIRKDEVLAVRGETVLQVGDEVLAVVASRQQSALEALLGRPNGSNQTKAHTVSKQP